MKTARAGRRARPSPVGEGLQVLVYSPDRADLFARICGYFDSAGFIIQDAKIHTTPHRLRARHLPGRAPGVRRRRRSGLPRPDLAGRDRPRARTAAPSGPLPEPQPRPRVAPRALVPGDAARDAAARRARAALAAHRSAPATARACSTASRACWRGTMSTCSWPRSATLGERVEDTFLVDGAALQHNRDAARRSRANCSTPLLRWRPRRRPQRPCGDAAHHHGCRRGAPCRPRAAPRHGRCPREPAAVFAAAGPGARPLRRGDRRALAGGVRRGPPARRRELAGARRRAAPCRRHAVRAAIRRSPRARSARRWWRATSPRMWSDGCKTSRASGSRWCIAGAAASARLALAWFLDQIGFRTAQAATAATRPFARWCATTSRRCRSGCDSR